VKKSTFFTIFLLYFYTQNIYSDSFKYNTFNNHGVLGIVNLPSARFYDESSYGITIYDGTPDQKITMTSFPFDWMEASFFYTSIQNIRYCEQASDPVCGQDYKDKGFNFKFRLKEEGIYPAIAIGINDIAGTGLYSSEYIVASYGIRNTDFHFGLGWGNLNGSKYRFKNPFGYLSDSFYSRPTKFEDEGGQFQPSRYYSDKETSPFFGLSHAINDKLIFKLEHDIVSMDKTINYPDKKSDFSYGLDYSFNDNFTISFSNERGGYNSVRFSYKNNPNNEMPKYKYKSPEQQHKGDKYSKLIKNIENNGIGVNKIIETPDFIGLELTQFSHPNLDVIEEIVRAATFDAGIKKEIKKDLRIADLKASSEYSEEYERNSKLIYERESKAIFNTKNSINFRPFLASREEFFKGSLLFENNSELILSDNLFFSSNLKHSIWDNFDDLQYAPVDTYPAQVRSDVKDYLRNFDEGIFIGRAQFDYHLTPKNNHHIMATAGILEEMYSGIGFEYLYFKSNTNYALGFEVFEVRKRDYKMRFGTLDYKNLTYHANFYYRNYDYIPFDAKFSYGEYLAGDEGLTMELSRTFLNGTEFGVFASFTDVSSEQFGEGTFDKGIFFNIPVYGNFINYTWRPLTKDPGAKLNRKYTLHDLLIKFKPYND
jgi:hypothetical protein